MNALTKEYFDQQLEKLVTKQHLLEFTNKIVFPHVGEIVEEKTIKFKDEILTSNDKLSVKLDRVLKEQVAVTAS